MTGPTQLVRFLEAIDHVLERLGAENRDLRAHLADVEADLHEACQEARESNLAAHAHLVRAKSAEARLAAIEALPVDETSGTAGYRIGYGAAMRRVRTAARGETP